MPKTIVFVPVCSWQRVFKESLIDARPEIRKRYSILAIEDVDDGPPQRESQERTN